MNNSLNGDLKQSDNDLNEFEKNFDRLKWAAQAKTDADLCRALKLKHQQSITDARKKKKIPVVWFMSIAEEYKVSLDWLVRGIGDPRPPEITGSATEPPPEGVEDDTYIYKEAYAEDVEIPRRDKPDDFGGFRLVPLAEAFLSAGGGAFVLSENMKENYAFRRDWLRRISTGADNLVLMRVRGMSMEPTIQTGDMVLIDKGRKRVHDGYIYALGLGETIVVKRLGLMSGGRVMILSDNRAEFPPEEVLLNDIRVIGQVIWYGRELVKGEE